ncbi:PIN domain-containing protein, partial [Acinetobacter baumannii]|nr:PIN domain-containing protein [Acinetobacter baumannii]
STLILLGQLDPALLRDEPLICTIILAELSVGTLVAGDERERAARQADLQPAESDFAPLDVDASAARAFGRIAASLRGHGRKPTVRALDALITAVAVSRNPPVYTCNPGDFSGIDSLDVRELPV